MEKDDIEKDFQTLETVVKTLQDGKTTLSESFELYKTGELLIKKLNKTLTSYETQLVKLLDLDKIEHSDD